jgi:predicted nucleotidyltransferase
MSVDVINVNIAGLNFKTVALENNLILDYEEDLNYLKEAIWDLNARINMFIFPD